jgi:capsular polysaccharide biosynthesis protein
VDSPRANGASVSQNLKRNLLIGIFSGAMLSVLALWLYSSFDTRIRNRRALELNFDIPVLGVIPKVSSDSMTVSAYLEKRRTDNAQ